MSILGKKSASMRHVEAIYKVAVDELDQLEEEITMFPNKCEDEGILDSISDGINVSEQVNLVKGAIVEFEGTSDINQMKTKRIIEIAKDIMERERRLNKLITTGVIKSCKGG